LSVVLTFGKTSSVCTLKILCGDVTGDHHHFLSTGNHFNHLSPAALTGSVTTIMQLSKELIVVALLLKALARNTIEASDDEIVALIDSLKFRFNAINTCGNVDNHFGCS
jgi:hypothetical protein